MTEQVKEVDIDALLDGKDRGRLTAPGDGRHLGQWRGAWDARAKISPTWQRAALAYTEGLEIEQDARSEAEEAAKDNRLTLQGQRDQVAAYIAKNAEKVIGIGLSVADLEAEADEVRAELAPENMPKPPADTVALRTEIRSFLRGLASNDERRHAVASDPRFAEAVLEQPAALSGVAGTLFDELVTAALDKAFPGRRDELADLEEATATLRRLGGFVAGKLQSATGRAPSEFSAFIAAAGEKLGAFAVKEVPVSRGGKVSRRRLYAWKDEKTGQLSWRAREA